MPLRYERAPLSSENPVGIDASAPPAPRRPGAAEPRAVDDTAMAALRPDRFDVARPTDPRRRRRALLGVRRRERRAVAHRTAAAELRFLVLQRGAARAADRAGATGDEDRPREHEPFGTRRSTTRCPGDAPAGASGSPKGRRAAEEITLRCDTLWIDTDRGLLVLTFRGVADAGGRQARTSSARSSSSRIRAGRSFGGTACRSSSRPSSIRRRAGAARARDRSRTRRPRSALRALRRGARRGDEGQGARLLPGAPLGPDPSEPPRERRSDPAGKADRCRRGRCAPRGEDDPAAADARGVSRRLRRPPRSHPTARRWTPRHDPSPEKTQPLTIARPVLPDVSDEETTLSGATAASRRRTSPS